jgi:prophage regulatory protein
MNWGSNEKTPPFRFTTTVDDSLRWLPLQTAANGGQTLPQEREMPAKVVSTTVDDHGFGNQHSPSPLPATGFVRWSMLKTVVPFSHETLRKLEIKGKFPRRVRISPNCAAWPWSEIHAWLADPLGYTATPAREFAPAETEKAR